MTISSFEFIKRATGNFKQSHYAQKQVEQTKNQMAVISGYCALEYIGNCLQHLNYFWLKIKKQTTK